LPSGDGYSSGWNSAYRLHFKSRIPFIVTTIDAPMSAMMAIHRVSHPSNSCSRSSMLFQEMCQTIVLVTHDESAAEYGDRTIRIEDGRVVESPHQACSVTS
jgi:ABC-type proline/glycine betaine transport system ATPase subunit